MQTSPFLRTTSFPPTGREDAGPPTPGPRLYHRLLMTDRAPSRFTPFRSPLALACFLLVAIVGLAADLWTKAAAWEHFVAKDSAGQYELIRADSSGSLQPLRQNNDVLVIPSVLELTAVANQGAAMGLGQGRKTLFIVVSIAAVGVLFYFFA